MKYFGISEQLLKQLIGKVDTLTERECGELFALLQFAVNGIEREQKRVDIINTVDEL